MTVRLLVGDVREVLKALPSESVHCVVTSPPYYGLRDYGVPGQIGLESTPAEYIAQMVAVFREVGRVLRSDGTCWINIGDSYAGSGKGPSESLNKGNPHAHDAAVAMTRISSKNTLRGGKGLGPNDKYSAALLGGGNVAPGCKPKDLIGIPWMLAFALRADGWYLREDIIWSKPNPMPESVQDRPTKAHEYLFLLSKSRAYYYDADAIREEAAYGFCEQSGDMYGRVRGADHRDVRAVATHTSTPGTGGTRNKRSVWTIPTEAFSEAHFATYPTALVEPCIKAGSPPGGVVLDPFFGAGTTGLVADRLGRDCIGIELNEQYAEMARRRIASDSPMFTEVSVA